MVAEQLDTPGGLGFYFDTLDSTQLSAGLQANMRSHAEIFQRWVAEPRGEVAKLMKLLNKLNDSQATVDGYFEEEEEMPEQQEG